MEIDTREDQNLLLWSWQTVGINLTELTVDHGKSQWVDNFPKYPELCEILSKLIGTNQFIWCMTQEEKTWKGREKWVLSVPKNSVRLICSITWNWILSRSNGETSRCQIPNRLFNLSRPRGVNISRDDFQSQFHRGWRDKTTEQLWDMLFVNEIGDACTNALVLCPIEKEWIRERPS